MQKASNKSLLISLWIIGTTLMPCHADTYIYLEEDGTQWFTDHAPTANYHAFSFVGHYGRPTATKSCHGVTEKILKQRADTYEHAIDRHAKDFKVNPNLIKAVISIESCFDRLAISRAGAKGLMQLMPTTAQRFSVTNVFDAGQNIKAGVHYLSLLLKQYDDNHTLALAAYNAGPRAVAKYAGVPPYKETQGYVKKVIAAYKRYAQHDALANN